jgi:hypothetical protein
MAMVSQSGDGRRVERLMLFGDALLLSTGVFVTASAIALGLQLMLSALQLPDVLLNVVGAVGTFITPLLGATGAWLLHARRIGWPMAVGFIAGWVVASVLGLLFGVVVSTVVAPGADSFPAWAIALGVLAGGVFVAFVGLVIADAVRDMRAPLPLHRRLDMLRFISAGLFVALIAAVVIVVIGNPMSEGGEAVIFAVAFSFVAGLMVLGADLLSQMRGSRGQGAPAEKNA